MMDVQISSSVEYARRLRAEWEHYVMFGGEEIRARQPIANSWKRCVELGVSAQLPNVRVRQNDYDVLPENGPLAYAVEPYLPQLTRIAEESNHIFVLADATGTIVHVDGAHSVRRDFAEQLKCVVGARWREQDAGTNALGTALATGEPIQVFGAEHFCESVHGWTCSAAPILDPVRRSILGAIDLTGQVQHYHPHSLLAVIAIARSIEERLANRQLYEQCQLLETFSDVQSSKQVDVIVMDVHFNVVKSSSEHIRNIWLQQGHSHVMRAMPTGMTREGACSFQVETYQQVYNCVLKPVVHGGHLVGAVFYFESALSTRIHASPGKLRYSFADILGDSPAIRTTIRIAKQSATCDLPVLIQGETGTGKELFAQSIHHASSRSKGPFLAVNCSAIPRELAVSELLGFVGGTFTGAMKEGNLGKFERASNGTLFLDEVEDMPLEAQAALLRVLEEREVTRLGGSKPIPVNVRLIAATNRSLSAAVAHGRFREDLYYRLNVLSFTIPPLHERVEDIPLFVRYYASQAVLDLNCPIYTFSSKTMTSLMHRAWPGNVRELKNFVYRTVMARQYEPLTLDQRSTEFTTIQQSTSDAVYRARQGHTETILKILEQTGGNVTETARRLGVNRSTIYRKLSHPAAKQNQP